MTCKINGCKDTVKTKGLCEKHYAKLHRYGDPLYQKPVNKCRVPDCDKDAKVKEFCKSHYGKWRNGTLIFLGDHWISIRKSDLKEIIHS